MPRGRLILIAGLFLIGVAVAFVLNQCFKEPALPAVRTFTVETAPLCPWRSPEADLVEFFPSAVGCQELIPECAPAFFFVATLQTALTVRIFF